MVPREGRPDLVLLIVTLILVTVGTVMIYSSSSIMAAEKYKDGLYFLKKQIFFVILGLGLMVFLTKIPYQKLKKLAYPVLIAAAIMLAVLLIPHAGVRAGGATRWLRLGLFNFQVTELAKVAVVLFLAHYLTRKAAQLKDFKQGILIPMATICFLIGLIILEPDFGTSAIIFLIMMLMFYLSGTRITHLAGLAAAIAPVALWLLVRKSYRMERLMTFLDPWRDPGKSGFQIIQSLLSFGSGGPFGVGIGDSMQKLFYLPEPHTDFILAIIAEESGFLGVALVIGLFTVFVFRGFVIAFRAADPFGTLLAAGLTMIIALEAFINIAGVMGLIPLKGLALPFLSYGGSSLIMSMVAVGILLNISSYES